MVGHRSLRFGIGHSNLRASIGRMARGARRRVGAEEQAAQHRGAEGQEDRVDGDHRVTPTIVNWLPTTPAATPSRPPKTRHEHGLDQELREDVAPPRADRLADADLARALGHRHEHDVHDADPADEQRDRGDRAEQRGEDAAVLWSDASRIDALVDDLEAGFVGVG